MNDMPIPEAPLPLAPEVPTSSRRSRFRGIAGKAAERILMSLAVLGATILLTFLAIHALPGSAVLAILGGPMAAPSPEEIASITHELGLDQPVWMQLASYIAKLARGDFGVSFSQRISVSAILADQIGATLALTGAALAVAWTYALTSVVLTARRGAVLSGIGSAIETTLSSLPQAWISLLLLLAFSLYLPIFPPAGNDGVVSIVLPALALGLPLGGFMAQVLRGGFDLAFDQPFVLASRMRGVGDFTIRVRHVLRHAVLPGVSISSWAIGSLMGNAVLVELIYSRQGLGRSLYTAVSEQDIPLAVGVTLVVSLFYVVGGLLADGIALLIDPTLGSRAR